MSLGDPYATTAEFKARLSVEVSTDDTRLLEALNVASRAVEDHCDRQFNKAASATARLFYPIDHYGLHVDDFHTTTGLVVKTDQGDDGTFETTWDATDYQLEPVNGIVSGESGWPYSRLVAVESRAFPVTGRRVPVEVTASWGWNAVPSPVKEATLILAEAIYKLKDAPHGIAGFDTFGAVRVRENPYVCILLRRYRRHAILVG